jgi:hypothetical protein
MTNWLLRLLLIAIPLFPQQLTAYALPVHHNCARRAFRTNRMTMKSQPTSDGQQQEDPFRASGRKDLMTTVKGGLATIFEMTQRQVKSTDEDDNIPRQAPPRWYPHAGIQRDNPDFRTSAPAMSNEGFARSIWRNARKRNKSVLWQNALRTYDRMGILQERPDLNIKRFNIHHEGAMLACAKLGLWQKCLEIYHFVDEQDSQTILPPTASRQSSSNKVTATSKISRRVYITDNMVQSLIRACTRASNQRMKGKGQHELDEKEAALRAIPLDTALEILRTIKENKGIPVAANHVNPLAAAYQSLGYVEQARDILQNMLSNRTAGEEPEDGVDILNVHDLCAKDKGSYSLLVEGAVGSGDWGAAVEALGDMTRVGLYPNSRHYNSWNEISERHRTRSWKKKRDDFWVNSVR